jgi:hypothetical protein
LFGLLAFAALVALSATAQAQTSPQASQPAVKTAKVMPLAGAPSLTPPDDVEGAWVDDPGPAPAAAAPHRPMPLGAPMMAPGMPGGMPMQQPPFAPPMYDENAVKAAHMYGGHPSEFADVDFSGDPYAEHAGGATPCDCEGCRSGRHCGHGGCCNDGPCGVLWDEVHSHRRWYFREEYLSLRGKGNPLPPLATTSTDPNIPQDEAGVLGFPETEILYGDDRVLTGLRNGGRITAGFWLVDGEFLGIEGHYMGLEQGDTSFFAEGEFSQGGNGPILARPFVNYDGLNAPVEASSLLAFENYDNQGDIVDLDGQISIESKVTTQSAGLLLRKLMWIEFTENWRLDGVAGYRFFRADDGVRINDFWTQTGGQLGVADFTSYDYFQARNEFHGGELGLIGTIYRGKWSLEWIGKIALGNVHQTMKIDGTSFVSVQGSDFIETGNYRLLTQPTNDGVYKRDVFAILPETTVNLRYDVSENLRLMIGYNFMYLSQMQRSGKAINLDVNTSQIGGALVGPALPSFRFENDNGFWLHGVSAGVELRF